MSYLKKLEKVLLGRAEEFSIRHRVLNAILLFMVLLFLASVFINAAIGESRFVVAISLMGAIIYALLYFISLNYKKFIFPAVVAYGVALFGYTPLLWLRDGGLTGGFPYFLVILGILVAIVFTGRWRAFFLISEVIVVSVLLIIERLYPELVTHCPGPHCVFYNNLWGFSLALLVVIIVGLVYIERFERANRKLQEYAARLEELSRKDPLTGLYNRRELVERLNLLLKVFSRNRTDLSIIMIDLDNFKSANDNYGHSFGDKILKEISAEWKKFLREGDIIGRWGGDEFLVILPHADAQGAKTVAERLKNKVKEISGKYSPELNLSLSAGVVQIDFQAAIGDLEHLLERADEALYKGKKLGGDRIIIAS